MHDYRKLKAWQASRVLVRLVYKATADFPRPEQYGLRSQARDAATSIPSNIAEGSGRGSDRDYARFVGFSIGSACELETLLILAQDLGYLSPSTVDGLLARIAEIRGMLHAFRLRLLQSAAAARNTARPPRRSRSPES